MDDLQRRVAARRAEIEREKTTAAAEARAEADARASAKRLGAEREWAEKARADAASGPVPADETLDEAVRRRWTAGEKFQVGALVVLGTLALQWSETLAAILFLGGALVLWNVRRKHREQLQRDYPDLFNPAPD